MKKSYKVSTVYKFFHFLLLGLVFTTLAQAQETDSDTDTQIVIQPADTTISIGKTVVFQAHLLTDSIKTNTTFEWNVSDSRKGSINNAGLFTSTAEGKVEVIATVDSLSGSVEVEIENDLSGAEDEDLFRIIPADTTIAIGSYLQLQAQYYNSVQWVDTLATWELSDPDLAILEGDSIYAEKAGKLNVFAYLDSLTAKTELEISNESEEDDRSEFSISIVPADTLAEPGTEITFLVKDIQTSEYISDSLSWDISSDLGSIDSNGTATLNNEGFGFVDVTYKEEKARTSIRVQELISDSSGTQSIVVNVPRNNPDVPPAVHNLKEGEVLRLTGFAAPLNYLNGGTIYFPPGSITQDIRIDVRREDVTSTTTTETHPNQDLKIVGGIGFDVFVSDTLISPFYFERPVEISIPYKRGLLMNLGIDVQNLSMFSMEYDGGLDSTAVSSVVVDTVSERIFGQVSHFSTYVLSPKQSVTTHIDEHEDNSPSQVRLNQNYPNPFNPTTAISFELPHAADVNLAVYDVLGRKVATVANSRLSMGTHTFKFDGSNLSSGMYMYRLSVDNSIVETRMMTLLK